MKTPQSDLMGILLINTGTPSAPTPRAVKRYLAKFLMHRRIRPMNAVCWWVILHAFILPKRKKASAYKYQQIWTEDGFYFASAHVAIERALQDFLRRDEYRVEVRHAMSFSKPRIRKALKQLRDAGCANVVVLPLYPQNAYSTTEVVRDEVKRAFRKLRWNVPYDFIDNYHGNQSYIRAITASIRNAGFDADRGDKVLFSYHSIPCSDIERGDTYELQTGASSLHIANELGIPRRQWTIGYQCRFDKSRDWIGPFTKDVLTRWAQHSDSRVFIVCPNFAVDNLETLYDVEYELKSHYFTVMQDVGLVSSDDMVVYVPCLNKSKAHIKVLMDVLRPFLHKDAE